EAERPADDRSEDDRAAADEQRQARPVQDAREEIAAELIGPEEMTRGARRLEALGEVGAEWVVRGEPRGGERREERRQRQADPEPFFHWTGHGHPGFATPVPRRNRA